MKIDFFLSYYESELHDQNGPNPGFSRPGRGAQFELRNFSRKEN